MGQGRGEGCRRDPFRQGHGIVLSRYPRPVAGTGAIFPACNVWRLEELEAALAHADGTPFAVTLKNVT